MMPEATLVSTIIPVCNRAGMLREAVASVLDQTHRPIEVVIVDDGSTDDTVAMVAGLAQVHPGVVKSKRQDNAGPGAARETGRQLATGEFIQYLDSDDLLLPRKFEAQVAALRQHPDCGIAYGMTHHAGVGHPLGSVPFKRTGEVFEQLFPALLESRWWSTSTPLYRREVTDRVGPWLPLSNEEDWEYEARAARLGVRLVFCPEFVSVTRWHDQGRLYLGGTRDPRKLRDRAWAHELILAHAQAAGIGAEQPEMAHFARELFLLARHCGAARLAGESQRLFDLACSASTPERAQGWDFRLYGAAARLLGWRAVAWLAGRLDRVRTR
jgi:glycosyltransferase involved in cell wall biosynthesis